MRSYSMALVAVGALTAGRFGSGSQRPHRAALHRLAVNGRNR